MSARSVRDFAVSSTAAGQATIADFDPSARNAPSAVPVALFDHACRAGAVLLVGSIGALVLAPDFNLPPVNDFVSRPIAAVGSQAAITIDRWSWVLGGTGAVATALWGWQSATPFGWRRALSLMLLAMLLIATPVDVQARLTPTRLGLWLGFCLVLALALPPLARRLRILLVYNGTLRLPTYAALLLGPLSVERATRVPNEDGSLAIALTLQAAAGDDGSLAAALGRLALLAGHGTIDGVLVLVAHGADAELDALIGPLSELPVDILVQPLPTTAGPILTARCFRPVSLHRQPHRGMPGFAKATVERTLAGLALLALSPLLLVVAALIRLDSPGPVFFRQPRFGYGHRPFSMLKFRTMFTSASDWSGAVQTSRNDARVTRIGRWLRRSSVDELPQLINVLLGDMALVGPRAHPVGMCIEGELYERVVEHYAARHRVKPGITGLAQVSGNRGAIDDFDKARARFGLDLRYMRDWSLLLDMKILLATVIHLFRRDEAY